jgi:hypothetical protein
MSQSPDFSSSVIVSFVLPTAPKPTSLLPCWVQPWLLRVKTHAAPVGGHDRGDIAAVALLFAGNVKPEAGAGAQRAKFSGLAFSEGA